MVQRKNSKNNSFRYIRVSGWISLIFFQPNRANYKIFIPTSKKIFVHATPNALHLVIFQIKTTPRNKKNIEIPSQGYPRETVRRGKTTRKLNSLYY